MGKTVTDTSIRKRHGNNGNGRKSKLHCNHFQLDIGTKIRKLRLDNRLTLQVVAKGTGLSPALISQIENNNVSPPIATLSRIAKFFEVKIGMFFAEVEEERRFEIVHANERKSVAMVPATSESAHGYFCESLSFRMHRKKMKPFLLTVTETAREESTACHAGEEFIFVAKGNAELILDGQRIRLSQGDSIYFDSSLEHRFVSIDGMAVGVLSVMAR